ncbi:MAG: OmpW family outer membrane protein [Pedobacter sp.]|nr:OmpW family outer membrane protein [Pedobacter sp.]
MKRAIFLAAFLASFHAVEALAEESSSSNVNTATVADAPDSTSNKKSIFSPKQGLSKGDNLFNIGWFHIKPRDKSSTVHTELNPTVIKGAKVLFDPGNTGSDFVPASSWNQEGTSVAADDLGTLALTFTHFLTDNWAVNFVGGIPPEVTLQGKGAVTVPGSVTGEPNGFYSSICLDGSGNQHSGTDPFACGREAKQPLATAKQWSPALVVQYYFNEPTARFRPYVGLGVSYNFFTDIEVGSNVAADMNSSDVYATPGNFLEIGYMLGTNPACTGVAGDPNCVTDGKSHVEAEASRSWAPVFNAGFSAELGNNFFATAALSYMPLKVTATMYLRDSTTNEALSTSTVTMHPDPLIALLGIGYRFGN